MRSASLIAILVLSVSCATAPPPTACGSGERAQMQETLYFGTDMPHGHVTAEQWQTFVATVITPRFPDGLTSWETAGQWRGRNGQLVKEKSYVLQVTHPVNSESEKAVREVMDAYTKDFQQEAVLRVRTSVCVSF